MANISNREGHFWVDRSVGTPVIGGTGFTAGAFGSVVDIYISVLATLPTAQGIGTLTITGGFSMVLTAPPQGNRGATTDPISSGPPNIFVLRNVFLDAGDTVTFTAGGSTTVGCGVTGFDFTS